MNGEGNPGDFLTGVQTDPRQPEVQEYVRKPKAKRSPATRSRGLHPEAKKKAAMLYNRVLNALDSTEQSSLSVEEVLRLITETYVKFLEDHL